MHPCTTRVDFHSRPLTADVVIPPEIVAMIVEKDRLICEATKTTDVHQKCKLYGESFPLGKQIREAITLLLEAKGFKVASISDYKIVEEMVPPEAIFTAEWKRLLVYNFMELNYIVRREVMEAINPIYASRGGDPKEAEAELFKWCEREGKLSELRHLVTLAMKDR